MAFVSDFKLSPHGSENASWFLFHDQRLLLGQEGDRFFIPRSADLERLNLSPVREQSLGWLDDRPCFAAELSEGEPISGGFFFMGLRRLFTELEEDVIQAAGLANHLVHWNRSRQHCGRCGHPTESKTDERGRVCPRCGMIHYPRLSPAIIVAVLKDHEILLAHAHRFPGNFYSVLAGFVQPGETLEECVQREVMEEVGVSLKNIRYFGSQPWPFPDSLMIAFTADYDGGTLRVDPSEITDAGWFLANQLPAIPPRISIARRLIDWFLEREGYSPHEGR